MESFALDPNLHITFPVVSFEETFAGKIVALLARGTARDIYEVHQLVSFSKKYDRTRLKRAILFIGACGRKDWRQVSTDSIDRLSEREFNQQLRPLLRTDATKDFTKTRKKCKALAEKLLKYNRQEKSFLAEFLNRGKFKAELLYPDDDETAGRLQNHPAQLWKAENIVKYKQKLK